MFHRPIIARRSPTLVSGLLRTPWPSRLAARVSETAIAGASGGPGWIERSLIESSDASAADDLAERLAADIVAARVGGAFWAPPVQWPSRVRRVVKLDRPGVVEKALGLALELSDPADIGLVLPQRSWARRAAEDARRRGISCHLGETDPWALLDRADDVLVDGDDDLVLLALLMGRRPRTMSPGALTGWGLTEDPSDAAQRGQRNLRQVARAALIDGVRYYDPFTGKITDGETTVERLADLRRMIDEDRDLACLAGVARWKRRRLRRFFTVMPPGAPFVDDVETCVERARSHGGAIGIWPSAAPERLISRAAEAGVNIWRIEDGFVRSVGLGSDLLPPCSIVADRLGIYYDPREPSDLERILMETAFTDRLRRRGEALVERLLATRITKYNTGGGAFARPTARRVVLVPGQVEDDLSFILGGAGCRDNLDLARRARTQDPDAHIIYRPHPDVEAGNRRGAVRDEDVLRYADQIDRTAAMPSLLEAVDAIHTVSSLAGFEALLRGREVIVHGQPFYAGWGLTRDLAPPPRRGRSLSLAELVVGALILYPRYLDPVTGLLCPPEVLIERLAGRQGGTMISRRVLRTLRRRFERPAMAFARALAPPRRLA